MSLFNILAVLVTLSAFFSYLNHRYLGLPTTIGLMLIALLMSLGIIGLSQLGIPLDRDAERLLRNVDFNETLLHGMLSFLLFAGALHININDLAREKWVIASLATGGVILSTFIIGYLTWWVLNLLGHPTPMIYCLLFGALISPTDPIAVLGILKSAGAPKTLEVKITGESLFNDGVGVVVFLVLLRIAVGGREITAQDVIFLFFEEAVGGALFGLVTGFIAYRMLKSVDSYDVEILIALALSLPAVPAREVILAVTYAVVVFSIIVQGLTIGRLVGAK